MCVCVCEILKQVNVIGRLQPIFSQVTTTLNETLSNTDNSLVRAWKIKPAAIDWTELIDLIDYLIDFDLFSFFPKQIDIATGNKLCIRLNNFIKKKIYSLTLIFLKEAKNYRSIFGVVLWNFEKIFQMKKKCYDLKQNNTSVQRVE